MIVNRPFGALLVMALLCGCLSAWANGGNPPPLVSVSASTSHAAFGQTVTLTGDVTDPGDTHTFGWLQLQTTAGPTVVLSNLSGRTTRFTAPNVATFLTFRFTATDSVGQSASADILVQISESGSTGGAGGACGGRPTGSGSGTSSPQRVCPGPVAGGNNPPTATVAATYAIVGGNRASITATGVSDPDGPDVFIPGLNTTGPVIDYRWSVVDGGGFLASSGLTGRLTPTVSFDTPATPTPRTARLSLLVADALGCGSLYILDVVVQPAGISPPAASVIHFPRVGFGFVLDLEFQTVLVLDNLSPEAADDVLIEFFGAMGQPLMVRYLNSDSAETELLPWDASQPLRLAGRSSRAIEFRSADGSLAVGWARATSACPLRGSARFQLLDASGAFLSDVGIVSTPVGSEFQAAFRVKDQLAFAITNPGPRPVRVRISIMDRDDSGFSVEKALELEPGQHYAQFLSDFFPFLETGLLLREGTLRLTADNDEPISATVLITRDNLAVSSQSLARIR